MEQSDGVQATHDAVANLPGRKNGNGTGSEVAARAPADGHLPWAREGTEAGALTVPRTLPAHGIPGTFTTLWAPPPPRRSRLLRTVVSILLAVLFLGGLAYVIRGAFFGAPGSFPAIVQPAQESVLDFQNTGVITVIDVRPGERVTKGQVIATQDTQLDHLRLAYDQAVLASDQQSLAALQSSTAAQQQASQQASQHLANQRALQIQLAQEQLAAAQKELSVAVTPQEQVQAQAAITQAQTRLALAETAQSAATTPTDASAVAAAQAAVARDQSQLAADQLLIQQGTITAPTSGVIASVGGVVGDIAGPDGVVSPQAGGTSVPVAPGFSLFPPAAQAPSVKGSTTYPPLVTLYDESTWEVVAQVPQSNLASFRVGEPATVSLGGGTTLAARVSQVGLSPLVQNGTVYYDVVLTLDRPAAGLVPGMSGNVSLQPSKG